jgi:circadian clock protein KaiC
LAAAIQAGNTLLPIFLRHDNWKTQNLIMVATTNQASDGVANLTPTGLPGVDDVLGGGLPEACLYLVRGEPGSGKTTLAMQFLLEGVRRKERCLYISLSESRAEVDRVANAHGWSLAGLDIIELSSIEQLLKPEAQTTVFRPSEMELTLVTSRLLEQATRSKPARLVIDSLADFRLMSDTGLRYRRELLNFKRVFAELNCTAMLLDDRTNERSDMQVQSLVHGVMDLEQLAPEYGVSRRRFRVSKCRGISFREGFHDCLIRRGGLQVFPRLVAAEHRTDFQAAPLPSGIPEFDALMGGGVDRGTTTLFMGPAGAGKSTMALVFALALAKRGEKTMLFSFDETLGVLQTRARGLGMDLQPHIDAGLIIPRQVDPAELSPGELISSVRNGVHKQGVKCVIVDSLNGYLNAMPGEKFLAIQFHELCSYLNQQGIITLLVMAQHGMVGRMDSPVDLSYLADSVVTLRYFEAGGEVRQAVAVIKKRSGGHEKTIREFKLEKGFGIRMGEPLRAFHGVLTGVPQFVGKTTKILKPADDRQRKRRWLKSKRGR